MERTHAELASEYRKRQRLFQVRIDVRAHFAHQCARRITIGCKRTAAHARTISRMRRLLRVVEKDYVLLRRSPRRASRPAKDPGRGYAVEKFAVLLGVAGEYRLPA